MRHGTSIWNEQGKTQGRSNNRLSENGKKIIEKTASQLKNNKFDIMFCSPLMRAVQSANILRKKLKCKKIKDNRIIEIDQGIFTGKIYNQLTPLQIKQKESRNADFGMESLEDAYNRVNSFVQDIKKLSYDNVLVVTHHFVVISIEHILKTNGDFSSFKYEGNIKNGEVKLFEI